ncbi:preprotein translocase subunit SecE [Mycoplasma hafezii]|uniref:preprotein translocase subunit SecE n=1 Tax=Mycoplasma hafezii TaxID=525886 RepID=UPI003CEBF278
MFQRKKEKINYAVATEEQLKERGKQKRYFFRRVAKEIKRVRWPSGSTNWKNFVKIIIFTIIFVLFVYAVSIGFQSLWNAIGANGSSVSI